MSEQTDLKEATQLQVLASLQLVDAFSGISSSLKRMTNYTRAIAVGFKNLTKVFRGLIGVAESLISSFGYLKGTLKNDFKDIKKPFVGLAAYIDNQIIKGGGGAVMGAPPKTIAPFGSMKAIKEAFAKSALSEMFKGVGDIFKQSATGKLVGGVGKIGEKIGGTRVGGAIGKVGGLLGKGLGKLMGPTTKGILGGATKGLGKGLAMLGPQMLAMTLIMKPISALLEGLLEPLEPLIDLFGMVGEILGMLLVPIVDALMKVLMPFIPLLMEIVMALMPLIEMAMIPLLTLAYLLTSIMPYITWLISTITWFTTKIKNIVMLFMNTITNAIDKLVFWRDVGTIERPEEEDVGGFF